MKARGRVGCRGKPPGIWSRKHVARGGHSVKVSSLLLTFKRSMRKIRAQKGVARRECFVTKRTSLH